MLHQPIFDGPFLSALSKRGLNNYQTIMSSSDASQDYKGNSNFYAEDEPVFFLYCTLCDRRTLVKQPVFYFLFFLFCYSLNVRFKYIFSQYVKSKPLMILPLSFFSPSPVLPLLFLNSILE